MFKKTFLLALLVVGLHTAVQADENSSTSVANPQEPVALAALTPDGETPLLPQGKLAKIAAVAVPETAPHAKVRVLPDYPVLAQKARIEGKVFARVLVNTEGKVERVGQIKGHVVFHKAVAEVADQWQFEPAKQGELPVKAWVNVPFSFKL